jgi:hypothetical protein
MRARLKRLHSPDIQDLESWSPGGEDFGFQLQAMIGPDGSDGEESFTLSVCTPDWFRDHCMKQSPIIGSQTLFVAKYDYVSIKRFIERAVQRVEGDNWGEIAQCLCWLGEWEFANYPADSTGPEDRDVRS